MKPKELMVKTGICLLLDKWRGLPSMIYLNDGIFQELPNIPVIPVETLPINPLTQINTHGGNMTMISPINNNVEFKLMSNVFNCLINHLKTNAAK